MHDFLLSFSPFYIPCFARQLRWDFTCITLMVILCEDSCYNGASLYTNARIDNACSTINALFIYDKLSMTVDINNYI